ncbi:DGQHR domain-containing protein [Mesorhizobium sp. M7A.F.Ca.US.010.02.1.1]|uniref:DGQHR domain-containing protein n=1 Tax=Mesorhizobium sp. M7A.F.Ca.US.010.02.1.1 TaxID=2496743 RepID=UPI000FD59DE4|nr:DGQHR domain-containing protein [Mesorhizobium sp. M7A.F.Ca.US.010.02.1.1]RUW94400.1 DGQHR domain-containing protein [Mesorhizobium sp. M7A.F.Ca.US.010.02.1.1]
MSPPIVIDCLKGRSSHRQVLLGFAPADLLYKLSFPDILDEDAGRGYQRPFNERHSQDFRRYIKKPDSSTIPLTLNLRPSAKGDWCIVELPDGRVQLEISANAGKIMAQVDCQHRLGHLSDLPIPLPFMCFIGLSEREEMEVFSIINSKAKGLCTSLLDYHEAQLAESLADDRPELFIALQLNNIEESPWLRRLNLGGKTTSGLKRIASLRMMQQAVNDFLKASKILSSHSVDDAARTVLDFWRAVVAVMPTEWADPRRHMLTKGIGVYALMRIAADIFIECREMGRACDKRAFTTALADFTGSVDWSTSGPLKGFGGQGGVKAAIEYIRDARKRTRYKVVNG